MFKSFVVFVSVCICFTIIPMEQWTGRDPKYDELVEWVEKGDVQQVKRLLADGVQIKNNGALFSAIMSNRENSYEIIRELLQHKASRLFLDHGDGHRGGTPLIYGIVYGSNYNLQMVKLLLSHGASVNIADECLRTPLMHAVCSFPRDNIVAALLTDPSIDVHKKGRSGKGAMISSPFDMARENARSIANPNYISCNLELAGKWRKIGRMILAHLRFYSHEGCVAKGGLRQIGLPIDILKKIAASVDYEAAEKEFKL